MSTPTNLSKLCYDNSPNRPSKAEFSPKNITDIKLPCFVSTKIDAIRGRVLYDDTKTPRLWSNSGELIPNLHAQELFAREEFINFDGELVVGPPNAKDSYRRSESALMTEDGEPPVKFYVFDYYELLVEYYERYGKLCEIFTMHGPELTQNCILLEQHLINTYPELEGFERETLAQGYEGVICRSLSGYYKHGRSTLNEQYMVKLKRFVDGEATIVGFEEEMQNKNPLGESALGKAKRSSHKENLIPKGILGALKVVDNTTKIDFNIGMGFTQQDKIAFWQNQNYFIGKTVKYKHFPIGVKDKPRHAVFCGFRKPQDINND